MTKHQHDSRREFLGRVLPVGAAALIAPSFLAEAAGETPAKSNAWQIGCYTRPWAAFDYRVALDDIAAAGFKHVGLMTTKSRSGLIINLQTSVDEAKTIGDEVKKRGLDILSVWGGDIEVGKSLEAAIEGLRHLIDACAAAGARTLLLGGVGSEKLYQSYLKAIAACCDHATEKKVGLTIKPHGGLNATGSQLRKCVESVGKKEFTIWYDAGNILYYSDGKVNPVEDAGTVDGLVTGWCIKDFTDKPRKQVDLTPGTGQVDFRAVFARLKRGGFVAGPLVVETLAPGDRPHLIEEARKARSFLEKLTS